ncbi:MAG: hypothetical protein H0U76_19075 [Ktedonobacteraceae bacterium]|nr:hypothetical protein [Ktedonobacteraceae bacterium]
MALIPAESDHALLTLWSTQHPCLMCAAAVQFIGIGKVCFVADDPSDDSHPLSPLHSCAEACTDLELLYILGLFSPSKCTILHPNCRQNCRQWLKKRWRKVEVLQTLCSVTQRGPREKIARELTSMAIPLSLLQEACRPRWFHLKKHAGSGPRIIPLSRRCPRPGDAH